MFGSFRFNLTDLTDSGRFSMTVSGSSDSVWQLVGSQIQFGREWEFRFSLTESEVKLQIESYWSHIHASQKLKRTLMQDFQLQHNENTI